MEAEKTNKSEGGGVNKVRKKQNKAKKKVGGEVECGAWRKKEKGRWQRSKVYVQVVRVEGREKQGNRVRSRVEVSNESVTVRGRS